MRAQRLSLQKLGQFQFLLLVVEVGRDATRILGLECICVRRKPRALRTKMQFKGWRGTLSGLGQLRHLGDKRRDADAARQKQVLARTQIEREQVQRVADQPLVADLQVLVQIQTAAPACIVTPHRNAVAAGIKRAAHQRVRVHASAELHNHMRPAGKSRQLPATDGAEAKTGDQRVDGGDLGHTHGNLQVFGAHTKVSTAGGMLAGSSAWMQTPWKAPRRRE